MENKYAVFFLIVMVAYAYSFDHQSYQVYERRYPVFFQEYLKHTHEKEDNLAKVKQLSELFIKAYPDWFTHGIALCDVGCGNGYFSAQILKMLQDIAPSNRGHDCFIGIEPNGVFVDKTRERMRAFSGVASIFYATKIEDFIVDARVQHAANVMLASHSCYELKKHQECIAKLQALAQPGAIGFFIHIADSPIEEFKRTCVAILGESAPNYTVDQLKRACMQAGLDYCAYPLPFEVEFPAISSHDWQQLMTLPYQTYDIDYTTYGENFISMKHLLELFLDHPLEVFSDTDRITLVTGMRELLARHHNVITINQKIQVVRFGGKGEALSAIMCFSGV